MITYKEVDKTYLEWYDQVSMNVDVRSEYKVKRVDNGLGGLVLEELPVERMPVSCGISVWQMPTSIRESGRFYQKQGAVLAKIDMYAYYSEPEIRDEVQFVWYLDI